jgi:hypothetical protein
VPSRTANKPGQFKLDLLDADTDVTTFSIADMDHILSKLEREIYSITSHKQMPFKKGLFIYRITFKTW